MNIIIKIILFLSTLSVVISIFILKRNRKFSKKIQEDKVIYDFKGPALNNYKLYKEWEVKAINSILASFPKFTKDALYQNVNELARRIINGQNNGYISQNAFQKSATDKILIEIRNMKQVDLSIINYENNYMSAAIIYENSKKELYQLLMKINVQNGLLYLDSYNAAFWFTNN